MLAECVGLVALTEALAMVLAGRPTAKTRLKLGWSASPMYQCGSVAPRAILLPMGGSRVNSVVSFHIATPRWLQTSSRL